MVDDPKAAILTIAVISIIAFAVGCVAGGFHVGEEISEEIIPTSLTSSDDMIKPIKETNTTLNVVSIKQPQQKKVTKNYTKNYTSNNTTSNNTNNTKTPLSSGYSTQPGSDSGGDPGKVYENNPI